MTWLSGYFPHGPMLLFTIAAAAAGLLSLTASTRMKPAPSVPAETQASP